MVFLPALKYADNDTTYTGIQMITGLTVFDVGVIADGKIPFSFLALMAFALPVIAGISALSKNYIIPVVLFIAAAVLLFLLPTYTVVNVTSFIGTTELEIDWVLQTGSIVAGSLSIVGALFGFMGFVTKEA